MVVGDVQGVHAHETSIVESSEQEGVLEVSPIIESASAAHRVPVALAATLLT